MFYFSLQNKIKYIGIFSGIFLEGFTINVAAKQDHTESAVIF